MPPVTTDYYVPIQRFLRENVQEPLSPFALRLRRFGMGAPGKTWNDYFLHFTRNKYPRAIVLLGPSNAGKTTELRHQVRVLTERGDLAFYVTALAVARAGLRGALASSGDQLRFDDWNATGKPAVLCIDAADEVYLVQATFSDVCCRVARDLDCSSRPIQVVVSARSGTWFPEDARLLAHLVGESEKSPTELSLEPIGLNQIGALARAGGVVDVERFLRAFEEDELDQLLELHPVHVRLFAKYWNDHGQQFGSWTDMLRAFVNAEIDEPNHARRSVARLSPARVREAFRRIAAACLLTQRPHLNLAVQTPLTGALDAGRLFIDWAPSDLAELFSRSFFFHKTDRVVQLPQGALSHVLAADWFEERARNGWELEDLSAELFVTVFGRITVPDSRAAVVGWVASAVPPLRQQLIATRPKLLLYEGDPSRLRATDIEAGLRALCSSIACGREDPMPTRATVRQLALPELQPVVLALLEEHRGSAHVEQHLLRYVELGHYQDCVDHAMGLAMDGARDAATRMAAISALGAIGSGPALELLLPLASDPNGHVRAAVLEALVPRLLSGKPAVDLLLTIDHERLPFIRKILDKMATSDIDTALATLLPSLKRQVIDEDSDRQFRLGVGLVISRLGGHRTEPLPEWFPELLLALEKHIDDQSLFSSDADRIRRLLSDTPGLKDALWDARIATAGDDVSPLYFRRQRLDRTELGDLISLHARTLKPSVDAHIRDALLWEIEATFGAAPPAGRSAFLSQMPALPTALLTQLEEHERRNVATSEERARRRLLEDAQDDERRAADRAVLLARKQVVERGDDLRALQWAWEQASVDHGSQLDLRKLSELAGPELTAALLAGFKACWRRQAVALDTTGGTPIAVILGLIGLSLELMEGIPVAKLSPSEAELAARYALHELSGFPPWLDALRGANDEIVRTVLREAVNVEWRGPAAAGHLISKVSSASAELAGMIADTVLGLLHTTPPPAPLARAASTAILFCEPDPGRVSATVRGLLDSIDGSLAQDQALWLRVWAHVQPRESAQWLAKLADQDEQRYRALVTETASLLEDDFEFRAQFPSEMLNPAALAIWLPILFHCVPPEGDRAGSGAFVPTSRDRAERLRGRFLRSIVTNPSEAARHVLLQLSSRTDFKRWGAWFERMSEAQLAAAAEATARRWTEDEVVTVETRDERRPADVPDLDRAVQRHLRTVALLVENHDFSYRHLFNDTTDEREMQLWLASTLDLVSRGAYWVIRERAVQDEKKVDISAHGEGRATLPIEVKPAGGKGLEELKSAISGQLYERYMRPPRVTHGILVVFRNKRQRWVIDGHHQGFAILIEHLQAYARQFGEEKGKNISVVGIDLVGPDSTNPS
jgi:hypothetical protein